MNAVPASQRGAASGVRATGMNAGMVISMGGFFTLMAIGLASRLPAALSSGLTAAGVDQPTATQVSHVPPVGTLFAAFLGDNPIQQLLPHAGAGVDTQAHLRPRVLPAPDRRAVPVRAADRLPRVRR